jgi:hypothetical protein
MRDLIVACTLMTVLVIVGVDAGVGPAIEPLIGAAQDSVVLQLDWLENLIERIDQLLETVVDLMNTVRELTGAEGGEGGD